MKATFNPQSSRVRAEGLECTGANTETSTQCTATLPFSMPSPHLLSVISNSNDIKKNTFVSQRLASMSTQLGIRDCTRYRSRMKRN